MRGRPKTRRASKGARKSTRRKTGRSKAARSKSARTKRAKSRKAPTARRKTARKSVSRRKAASKKSATRKSSARKTTARRAAPRSPQSTRKEVFGEGNYTAARDFRRDETSFVRRNRNRIPELGEKAAEALDGPEGRDLAEAEAEARSRSHSAEEDM